MARLGQSLAALAAIAGLLLAWPVLAPQSAPPALVGLVPSWSQLFGPSLPDEESIRIAVAVDDPEGQGPSADIVRGVRLLVERINARGGLAGRPLAIDVHDDGGDPDTGRTIAEWIATQTDAVAVVGHRLDDVAQAAGEVYAEYGVPVVTPAATAPAVTLANPWSFRTVANDDFLATYLAHYVGAALAPSGTVVVAGDDARDRRIAEVFVEAAAGAGAAASDPVMLADDAAIEVVLARLRAISGRRALLVAAGAAQAIPLVQAVHEAGLQDVSAIAVRRLDDGPASPPDGVLAATPLIDAIAGAEAAQFRATYGARFGEAPGWRAAFARDAAAAVVEAMSRSGAVALDVSVADVRAAIRDQLVEMDGVASGTTGVGGPLFFDANGDAARPPVMGRYERGRLVPAHVQFQAPIEPGSDARRATLVARKEAIEIAGHVLGRTDVVFAGAAIDSIEDLEASGATSAGLAGDLWFRYAPPPAGAAAADDVPPAPFDVVFLNAVDGVTVRELEADSGPDGPRYRRFRFSGTFRLGHDPLARARNEATVGVAFRHVSRPASRLIYVADEVGMGLADETGPAPWLDGLRSSLAEAGWDVVGATTRRGIDLVAPRGDPWLNAAVADGGVPYATLTAAVQLRAPSLLAGLGAPAGIGLGALVIGGVLFLATLALPSFRRSRWRALRIVAQAVGLGVVLVAAEELLLAALAARSATVPLGALERLFDALWWVVATGYLVAAANRLLWPALEAGTGQSVPLAARRWFRRVALLIGMSGALAFALDLPAVGLFGALVVAALAAILLVRADVPGLVAGLTLRDQGRLEVGDWVRIGGLPPARVDEIAWCTTRLVDLDGHAISLPNREVARAPIERLSGGRPVRDAIIVPIAADVPPATVMALIKDALASCAQIERDHGYGATLLGLDGGSQILLMRYRAWYHVRDFGEHRQVRQEIWLSIWERLESEGVSGLADWGAAEAAVDAGRDAGRQSARQAAPEPTDDDVVETKRSA